MAEHHQRDVAAGHDQGHEGANEDGTGRPALSLPADLRLWFEEISQFHYGAQMVPRPHCTNKQLPNLGGVSKNLSAESKLGHFVRRATKG